MPLKVYECLRQIGEFVHDNAKEKSILICFKISSQVYIRLLFYTHTQTHTLTHSLMHTWPERKLFGFSQGLLFSLEVMANSLQPHALQHAKLLCSLPTPGVCSDSFPLSWWCHPTIPSFAAHFSCFLHYFPALGPFPITRLFASGDQNIGASASASVLPMNI